MDPFSSSEYCYDVVSRLYQSTPDQFENLTHQYASLTRFCSNLENCEYSSKTEGKYSEPMVLIGIYISIASLFCVLAMALDLLNGFRKRKFWFPTKYFSLNAASITVISVAMKLLVDLNSPMPHLVEQVSKIGGLAFMCTMISNLIPSLASMDNKSLLANVMGLSILVVTLIVNIFIQTRTQVIYPYTIYLFLIPSFTRVAYIYMGMLLFLLIVLISSAITIPTSKRILEFKYQATSTNLNDKHQQENLIPIVEKLRQVVKRYWIMAETGSPQYVMASNPLSFAIGIICAISTIMYVYIVLELVPRDNFLTYSVYKRSTIVIFLTQSIGVVVGAIAPICRCFTVLSFKSLAFQNSNRYFVFKVEKYWTQKLCEWKESRISFLSRGRRSRALLHNLKNLILSFCIGFQKIVVVSCKIIGLIPNIAVAIFTVCCSYYFKSLKAMLFTPPINDTNEDLSNYVLLLEDNMGLAEKTLKGISNSMDRLIQNAEKKQHNNLLKLLEESVAFNGVEMFDNDQIPCLLYVEPVKSWSLPIISLTCIVIALPNIHKNKVNNFFKSVGEGLLFTHLVEESLNKECEYVNVRRATMTVWHEVEDKYKWLEITLQRSAYGGKTPTEIIKLFAQTAEEIVNEFNTSTNKEHVEKENLPPKVIAANSMYRIAQTIMHTYESNNLEIMEDELFTRVAGMIAGILAACLTNIPRVITMRCHESVIEKREASVLAAIDLLGKTTEILKKLETRELPNMDPDKMAYIDEWCIHLKQP